MLTLNAACSRRKVFWVWEQLFEITVVKKKTWNTNLTAWGFSYLHFSHLKQHESCQVRQHKMASFCQYFFFLCVQNLIPLYVLQKYFGWVSAAWLVKHGCCLWFWIEWEQTCPLLQPSPGSAVSTFSSQSAGACFLVAEMLSSWLEVRCQIILPQCLAFPVSWLLASACSPGCFSQAVTLRRELRSLVGLDFLAGAKEELDSAKTNLCIPASFLCVTLLLTVLGHGLSCAGLSSPRVQRVEMVYTAPNVLLQMF